jgi:cyclopropane-fatty-acyl-phospholipid synthase
MYAAVMATRRDLDAVTEGMKTGGYYDAHSEYQRRVVEGGDAAIRSIVEDLDLDASGATLTVADYGAGTGSTSVHSVKTAVAALRKRREQLPVLAVHNDVLTNDFTALFGNVASEDGYLGLGGGPVFPAAVGGSFFSQVLPSGGVQVGLCSNAVHWFAEQPTVRVGDGMFFSTADGEARRALAAQAAADWSDFLQARAMELSPGGRLFVEGIGRTGGEGDGELVSASRLLRVMWEVAVGLSDDELLDSEVLDRYVFPVYCRSADELTTPSSPGGELAEQLAVVSVDSEAVPNPYWEQLETDGSRTHYAANYTAFVRAFSESTLSTHLFGPGARGIDPEDLCDQYFTRFETASAADPERGRYEAWILRLVLVRS